MKEKIIIKLFEEHFGINQYSPAEIESFARAVIGGLSLPVEAKVSQENDGRYKADIKTIWAVKEIKIGDSKIKIVADTQVPKDEFWLIDENNDIQKFRMINAQ